MVVIRQKNKFVAKCCPFNLRTFLGEIKIPFMKNISFFAGLRGSLGPRPGYYNSTLNCPSKCLGHPAVHPAACLHASVFHDIMSPLACAVRAWRWWGGGLGVGHVKIGGLVMWAPTLWGGGLRWVMWRLEGWRVSHVGPTLWGGGPTLEGWRWVM